MNLHVVEAPQVHYVHKGWGYEQHLCNNDKYCGKKLHFWKGKKLSFHFHELKDETFWVLSGRILLRWSWSDTPENELILGPGDTFHVLPKMRHQIAAIEESDVVEFSTTHFDEDSYRIFRGD